MEEDEEYKTVFAHFGAAFYYANRLEHGMINALVYFQLFSTSKKTPKIKEERKIVADKYYDDSFSNTFGQIKAELKKYPHFTESIVELNNCNEERNFLAHHFFRYYAQYFYHSENRKEMIRRLENARLQFDLAAKNLSSAIAPIAEKYGITQEIVKKYADSIESELRKSPNLIALETL